MFEHWLTNPKLHEEDIRKMKKLRILVHIINIRILNIQQFIHFFIRVIVYSFII